MRFRFCGDLDCPDWVLAEINILSKMTSVKMKLLCQQVVRSLLGEEMDYDKVKKLTADAKYELSDIKASVAALAFIFTSSARHGVDEEAVSSELQQLGLPKEHSQALCKIYADHFSQLVTTLREQSLRLSKLEDIQWRVDYVISSNLLSEVMEPEVHLRFRIWDLINSTHKVHQFSVTPAQFHTLLSDLKRAKSLMENL